jgi:hypothetical protein
LIGLGTISYSVYLVHPVLLAVTDGTIGRWQQNNLVLEVAFYAVLIPLCVLTYRYIEAPSQTWGRKLARRVQPPWPGRAPQVSEGLPENGHGHSPDPGYDGRVDLYAGAEHVVDRAAGPTNDVRNQSSNSIPFASADAINCPCVPERPRPHPPRPARPSSALRSAP